LVVAGVAGLLLSLPGDVDSQGHAVVNHPAPHPVVVHQPPPVVHVPPPPPRVIERSPALGVVNPPRPVVIKTPGTTVIVPKGTPTNILVHEPNQPVGKFVPGGGGPGVANKFEGKLDNKAFIENTKGKFAGGGTTAIKTGGGHVDIERVSPKSTLAIVGAQHSRLGGRDTFIAGGKTINIRNVRNDLVAAHERSWQQHLDLRHERGLWITGHLPPAFHNFYAPGWWNNHLARIHVGWWGRWPGFAAAWLAGWAYGPGWNWWHYHDWPTFIGCCYPGFAWGAPYYYDYGPGGNVVFDNGAVYIQGTPVCSEPDYYAQAAQFCQQGDAILAGGPPPTAWQDHWCPCGVWALSNETEGDATLFLQMAVTKQGVIMGTFYNTLTDEALPILGSIDPNTQRAAWYVGDNRSTIYETGAYNLTQPETQVLIHFGPERFQTWLMVRVAAPPR
jgi:hypothetical protein